MVNTKINELSIDTHIYPKAAILKTANQLSEEFDFLFQLEENGNTIIVSYDIKECVQIDCEEINRNFMKNVLHNSVRTIVNEQTQTVKELLIGRALYHTCIVPSEGCSNND